MGMQKKTLAELTIWGQGANGLWPPIDASYTLLSLGKDPQSKRTISQEFLWIKIDLNQI